jgi:hypothetical protein
MNISTLAAAGERLRRTRGLELAAALADGLESCERLEHERSAALESRYRAGATARDGKRSRGGSSVQCAACKRLRTSALGPCEGCGFMQGTGYVGIPAPRRTLYDR